MILDADTYRINVKPIKSLLADKLDPKERLDFISVLAIVTGVPIIIVAYYVAEIYGLTPDLEGLIGRLKAFYTVDTVLNTRV